MTPQEIAHDSEVIRIRLWNALRGSAVVSEAQCADRVLDGWAAHCGCSSVMFEVTFDDGLVLQGAYDFFRKGRRKCRFATHLQRTLERVGRPDAAAPASPPQALARCFVRA